MSSRSRIGSFFSGLFTGILLCVIAAVALGVYGFNHPEQVIDKAMVLGGGQLIEKKVSETVNRTVETIPKDYVAMKQQDINRSFNKLTTAYSEGKLSDTDMQMITGYFYQMMADQKVTSQEIEKLLKFIDSLSK